ncbi:hypothetical protein JCM10207_008030 [Rhodosporidiobolus poonsookiae]
MGRKRVVASTAPTNHTAFRQAERRWKDRTQLDLSLAFDPTQIVWDDAEEDGRLRGTWTAGNGTTEECWRVSLGDLAASGMGQSGWKGKEKEGEGDYAVVVPRIPGLVLFPSILPEALQRALVVETLQNAGRENLTNLDNHYELPDGGLWAAWLAGRGDEVVRAKGGLAGHVLDGSASSGCATPTTESGEGAAVPLELPDKLPDKAGGLEKAAKEVTVRALLPKLRWSNVGYHYNWTTKLYEFDRGFVPLPPRMLSSCRDVVRQTLWRHVFTAGGGELGEEVWKRWSEDYEPDAGIVNFYQLKDSLTAHVDLSEVDAVRPLVSFSLGHSSIFLVGGLTRDVPPLAILLRSGDGLCMSGQSRRAYHGLPRVLAGTLPDFLSSSQPEPVEGADDWRPYGEYLERGVRINVNVRSVF